jgi:hypothetical protein
MITPSDFDAHLADLIRTAKAEVRAKVIGCPWGIAHEKTETIEARLRQAYRELWQMANEEVEP